MQRAADAAREGNAQNFMDMNDEDLQALCSQKDEDGRTLLHSAAVGGNLLLVQLLIDRCSASNAVSTADPDGWTPLMSAVSCGHEEICKLLLSLGADPSAVNKQGRTALHYAASKGRVGIIKLLLQSGAVATSKDCLGALPLHRAAAAGHSDAIKELLAATPRHLINAKDASGATSLLLAASCGHQAAAIVLAGSGADVEVEDKEGQTPLGAAAPHGEMRAALVALATGEKTLEDFNEASVT